ncbi:BamA/TamA family outer membrane protein [Planctomicrobium sp. SH527]|uniref:BamA/OMP85 family outer membrane protein n=1 Tax=Planctomicrobium sp. SH527 TaxID=3448123 RepID=UPI003F5B7414
MQSVGKDTRRVRHPRSGVWTAVFSSSAAICGLWWTAPVLAQRPFPGSEATAVPVVKSTSEPWAVTPAATKTPSNVVPAAASSEPLPAIRPATRQPVESAFYQEPAVKSLPATEPDSAPSAVQPASFTNSLSGIRPGSLEVQQANFSAEKLLESPLVDVLIEGNDTIRTDAIFKHVQCRPGRQANPRMVQQDVTQLLNTRWFYSVQPLYRNTDEGPILVFKVVEKPILKSVTFRGNKKIKSAELEAHTGLRPGHAFDVSANRESIYRIRQLYLEKHYRFAEVTLTKGGASDDREVIFDIVEGPKTKIGTIEFQGNHAFSSAILKTKVTSKTLKLWIIQGDYDPEIVRNDVLTLKQYYMGLGYFDVDVQSNEALSEDRSRVTVTFAINEGRRYKVEGIEVLGNDVVSRDKLLTNLKLNRGDYFNERYLKEDVNSMTKLYDEQGRLFAKVIPTPRFREGEEPVVDLVYKIDEDVPRYIGAINIRIRGDYTHSQEEVVRQQVNRFLKPGHLAKSADLRMAQARVNGSGIWDREEAPVFDIKPVSGLDYWPQVAARGQSASRDELQQTSISWEKDEFWSEVTPDFTLDEGPIPAEVPIEEFVSSGRAKVSAIPTGAASTATFDSDAPSAALPSSPRRAVRGSEMPETRAVEKAGLWRSESSPSDESPRDFTTGSASGSPLRATVRSDRDWHSAVAATLPPVVIDPESIFRGQSEVMPEQYYRSQSMAPDGLQVPQDYMQGVSPQGDPFGDALSSQPPGFVDVNIDVTEGRTGRLMFGVGVNSDAGVVGSLVLQEDNFDLLRPPTSWADILNGTAWRGAGQSFRMEAVPGSEVSRYMVSWNDPYFLRSDFSFGVSGFYYNRYFEAWREDRLGGRINTGYVLNRFWSLGSALRLEEVKIKNVPAGAPASLTDVEGDNFLSTASVSLMYDGRDNAFMPSRGTYGNISYEQGFGEFNYPRFDLSGSQYFTLHERPDGFGKHILAFNGQLGFTGDNTPIFEKYYAGGYSSFRGFYFRGVSPVDSGVRVGGNFMALGSVEYMVPLTASDNVRAVVFSDFGTVQENVSFSEFRASAGFGFRVTLPAMGPAPLAFDFAWPITREPTDRLRVFSFYVGFTR